MTKSDYFILANARTECRKEYISPSGKYLLVVTPYSTGKGSWSYTQGLIYNVSDNSLIAEIQRNYSSFPFEWVENHPNGHSYLVCGEDYQGQTVVELDTCKMRSVLSEGAKNGAGFCWIESNFNKEHQILVVDGCHWACPYEFRFFDFSDPMNGWPEIELDNYVDADKRSPQFNLDGTLTCFQSEYMEDDDDDDDLSVEKKEPAIASTQTFRREGLKFIRINEWVSDKEQKIRSDREEGNRKYNEWLDNFKKTDPLYLEMNKLAADPIFTPEEYISIGITHKDWCPDFTLEERRMCRTIQKKSKQNPYSLEIEFATDTGPVKLVVYKDGKHLENKFFYEHSVDSIRAAFDYSRSLICAPKE